MGRMPPRNFLALQQVFRREHGGVGGGFVGGIGEKVPAAEDQIFERGERDEILDRRGAILGALAEANGAQLRDRADRLRAVVANQVHAGHEGGGHGAHADGQDAEFSLWRCNGRGPAHEFVFLLVCRIVKVPREIRGRCKNLSRERHSLSDGLRRAKINIMRKARENCK